MSRLVCLCWDVGFVVSDMVPPVGCYIFLFLVFLLNCVDGGIVPYR